MSNLSDFPIVDERAFVRDQGSVVGRGGFGTAYLARTAGQRVVIKELHQGLQSWYAERFAQEARTLSQLDHESIVRVMQLGRWRAEGPLFYAMEYVEGSSLDKWLDPRSLQRQLDNLSLLVDVARAVQYAHRHGVIHRDLKPSNVVVRTNRRAVVVDWGFAGEREDDVDADDRIAGSFTRYTAGTPFYMSPEQALGQPATAAMDVYSFGAMLYEFLRGDPPFRDVLGAECSLEQARTHAIQRSPTEIYVRGSSAILDIARCNEAALHSVTDKTHAQLHRPARTVVGLATRCLDKDPTKRPAMDEVVRTMESAACWCVCAHCDRVGLRTESLWIRISWKCKTCRSAGIFDDAVEVASPLGDGPSAQLRNSSTAASSASAPALASYDGIVRGDQREEHNGVLSTLARDELDREVVLEELLPTASVSQRSAFETAVAVLTTSGSPILPKIFRAGPTMFVREHVSGCPVSELVERLDDNAVRALRNLCQAVVALHRQGIAFGGLYEWMLIIPTRAVIEVVMVNWRQLTFRSLRGSGSWQSPHNPEAIADVRTLVEIMARLFATTQRWLAVNKLLATLAKRRSIVEADLERVAVCLNSVVRAVHCRCCHCEVLEQDAVLSGLGYACRRCSVTQPSGDADGLDMYLTVDEQAAYFAYAAHHHLKQSGRLMPLVIAALLLALVGRAVTANCWDPWDYGLSGGVLTATAFYHLAKANLRRHESWIPRARVDPVVRITAIVVVVIVGFVRMWISYAKRLP